MTNAILQFNDENLEGEIINLKADNDYVFEFMMMDLWI